jgi:hypothetical protein
MGNFLSEKTQGVLLVTAAKSTEYKRIAEEKKHAFEFLCL